MLFQKDWGHEKHRQTADLSQTGADTNWRHNNQMLHGTLYWILDQNNAIRGVTDDIFLIWFVD